MLQFIFGVVVGLVLETYTGWGSKIRESFKNTKL